MIQPSKGPEVLHGLVRDELADVPAINDAASRVLANPENWPDWMYEQAVAEVEATKDAMRRAKDRKVGKL